MYLSTGMLIFVGQVSAALACAMSLLGFDWLLEGHGVHPMLAGGFVALLMVVPYILVYTEEYDDGVPECKVWNVEDI